MACARGRADKGSIAPPLFQAPYYKK